MAGIGQLGLSAAIWCVAGALTLHATIAAVALSASPEKKVLLPTKSGAPVLQTRLVSLRSNLPISTASLPIEPVVEHAVASAENANLQAAPKEAVAAEVPAAAPLPEPTLLAAVEPPDSHPTPSPQPLDDYLPRDLLTQAPSASQPILLDFPADLPEEQRLSIVLRLYVDELGIVRRVARVGGDTQEQAQTIAEQAFLQARFNPGEVEGHPVKSIIHVEVTFDSTSLDPAQ